MTLITAGRAELLAQYFQFSVMDVTGGQVADFPLDQFDDRLIKLAATPGWAIVHTGHQFGHVDVAVEVHDAGPPAATGWEEVAQADLISPTGTVGVAAWGDSLRTDLPTIVVPPGSTIAMRVHATGRAQARDHEYDSGDDDAEDEPEQRIWVHYLIQLWPAARA